MATSNIVSALGAGSGIDVKALAEGLVDAERKPLKERIEAKISKTEARISGYGGLKYSLSELKAAFEKLNDASDFGTLKVANSQTAAFSATATNSASAGSYSIQVSQLASPQRTASLALADSTTALHSSDISLSVNGVAGAITVTDTTPTGVVAAINASGLGLSAELIRDGSDASNPYRIVVTGQDGSSNGFTIAVDTSGTGLGFSGTNLSTASDALMTVNGLPVTRTTNTVSDVIPNVTLALSGLTTGTTGARLDLSRDTQAAKDNIKGLVTAYNDFQEALKILGDTKSEVEVVGGSLAGDRILQTVRAQIRNLMVGTSSTASGTITAARDVGLSIDRTGRMTLNETKLDAALAANFSDVKQMFSAGTDNKSLFSTQAAGLAGDAVVSIDKMLRSTGLVSQQTVAAGKDVTKYKAELEKLEARMSKVLDRYINEFSVMESLVGNTNSLRENLKSSFEGMMAAYTQ